MKIPEISTRITELCEEIEELEELVLWLAKPFRYEDPATGEVVLNDPVFALTDWNGEELQQSKRLSETWSRVVKSPADRSVYGSRRRW